MSTNITSFAAFGWPEPNYINPQTRGPTAKILFCILVPLSTVIVLLRIWTRHFISKTFGLDDVLMLLAYLPATVYAIMSLASEVFLQGNRHTWDVEPRFFSPSLQIGLAEVILFDLATSTTKLSMLATINRLTRTYKSKRKNIVVLIIAVIISLNAFIFIVVVIFQCSPISAYWTIGLASKKCINEEAHLLAAGIINTVTEFIVVFLPMSTVLKLSLPKRQRAIVLGLFATGFLACGAGIARIIYTWLSTSSPDHDTVWNAWAVRLVSGIELYLGIICASIPAIKPFFATYLPNLIDANIPKIPRYGSLRRRPEMKSTSSIKEPTIQTWIPGNRPSSPSQPLLSIPKPALSPQYQHRKTLSGSSTSSHDVPAINTSLLSPVLQHRKALSADQAVVVLPMNPLLISPVSPMVANHLQKTLSADLNKPLPTIAPRRGSAPGQQPEDTPRSAWSPPPPPATTITRPSPQQQRSLSVDSTDQDGGLLERQFSTQRNARRFSNSSASSDGSSSEHARHKNEDRTTVVIMFQDDQVSSRSFF
ncbi:hypothetical protein BJ166DRAFT_244331 [Pestalotiopsis sp. NC0098]|nr:hypothetical protein BJ166DRAFT_244331 [Pestalotiopsis sp. NC0098]